MNNTTQLSVPILDGKNYNRWCVQMKVLFDYHDLLDVVENPMPALADNATDAQRVAHRDVKKKDKKALYFIHQGMNDETFAQIEGATSSSEAWSILSTSYKGDGKITRVRLQTLRRQYELLQMEIGETVDSYINKVIALTNNMKNHGEIHDEQTTVEKILRTLTPRFEHIVAAIEEGNDTSTMTIKLVSSSLRAHEQRMNNNKIDKSVEQAFRAQVVIGDSSQRNSNSRSRGRGRGNFQSNKVRLGNSREGVEQNNTSFNYNRGSNSFYHQRGRGRGRGRGRTNMYDKSNVECFICHRRGHYSNECRSKGENQAANYAQEGGNEERVEEDHSILMVSSSSESPNQHTWYLDTGCTNHMCGQKELFADLDESFRTRVKFGDGRYVPVTGKGQILIKTKKGDHRYISNVFYVPELKSNLLSMGQLVEKGYGMHVFGNQFSIFDKYNNLVLKTTLSRNRMFSVDINQGEFKCLKAMVNDESWLWHLRFGHLNFQSLETLGKRNFVNGMPNIHHPNQLCEACILGKNHRAPFTKESWRAKYPLELVHTDVCGPMNTPSIGGNKYFLTFIDDFSRKTWVYLLKRKDEVFDCFKKFKSFVERQNGRSIKMLRSDGGGEYTSNEFKRYCEDLGVQHKTTFPYTPQHNGVAERKNRTILDMARSMLKAKGMPNYFWAEAISCAVYLLNRSFTRSVPNATPIEAWSGFKPNVQHLKVFGSIAYVHIPTEKRTKLDDKAEKMIFIGYKQGGYKLYNPITGKVICSRDVTFAEDEAWKWDVNTQETSQRRTIFPLNEETEDESMDGGHVQPTISVTGGNGSSEATIDTERSRRQRQPPTYLQDYEVNLDHEVDEEGDLVHFAFFAGSEPMIFEDAIQNVNWKKAMDEEIAAIEKNNTWELTDLPKGCHAIDVKWVYKIKMKANGEIERYKARLVAKGFEQREGYDYEEIFSPVARMETVRLIISVAAQKKWRIHQMDVKSAFLNGTLDEKVYVKQPPGFVQVNKEEKVYKLNKALYGLKQAPRAWNRRIDLFLHEAGFQKCPSDHGLYVKANGSGDLLILCLYVDDVIFTGNNSRMISDFKRTMTKEFEMTDLGLMSYFLGIEVVQKEDGIFISQKKYAAEFLKKYQMEASNPVKTPVETGLKLTKEGDERFVDSTYYKQIVGGLRYLTCTRPDICYAVGLVSRFMESPRQMHLQAVKRIMRYIKGTHDYGLFYSSSNEIELVGYSDSDWGGDLNERKSTSGFCFMIGKTVCAWSSKKQSIVALSTCEAEYVAASASACQAIWLRNIMGQIGFGCEGPTKIYVDNNSAIRLAKNPVFHGRSKHIDIRHHFLRYHIADNVIKLEYCKSEDQIADILTKPLKIETFVRLRNLLGVTTLANQN